VTVDISSESANLKPKKRAQFTNNPAIPAPEAPNTFLEHPPTNHLYGRARASSSRKRSTRSARKVPADEAPRAEAVSRSEGTMDHTLNTASAEAKVISAGAGFDAGVVSANSIMSESGALSGTSKSSNNVRTQSTTPQSPGVVLPLDEANPDTEDTIAGPVLRVSRSATGSNEATLDGLRTSDLKNATPSFTDLPPAYKTPQAAEATSSAIEPTYHDLNTPEPHEQIQILDLHTDNPLISYQKQLYSCTWTSTIGTDLLLASSNTTVSLPILKRTPTVNILAASGIKLIGRPVRPIPKEEERLKRERIMATLTSSLSDTATQRTEVIHESKPVTIPVDAGSSIGRQNQARFLERLIAIKAAKGEKDNVTVYAQKTFTGTGWRAKQRADRETFQNGADMDNNDKGDVPAFKLAPNEPLAPKARKGTGVRRGSRKTKAKGGLFRDYRPKLWDEVGADDGRDNPSTPRNWNGLSDHREDGPPLVNGSLDAVMQIQTMKDVVPIADDMTTYRISQAPSTEHIATSTASNLVSSSELDQYLRAQDVTSSAAAAVPEIERKESADVEMEDAPP